MRPRKQESKNDRKKDSKKESKKESKKDKILTTYQIIATIFAIIVIVQTIYIFYPSALLQQAADITIPDISTSGFAKVDKIVTRIVGDEATLSLRSGCYDLTAGVEPFQSISIQNGIDGKVGARPNAHDIAKDVFSTLKIDVLMVKITERRESAYFSKLVLRQGNTILNFDARPSDAIAIAVRMKADVYINETLLKTEGKNIC